MKGRTEGRTEGWIGGSDWGVGLEGRIKESDMGSDEVASKFFPSLTSICSHVI